MYIDYSLWDEYEYKVSSLTLDLDNPRLGHIPNISNQTQIIQYLITNERVYELAKKISEEGFFVGEEPIICIERNKKIVLEGNRRVAALKLLKDPTKYLPTTKSRILLKNIASNNIDVNRKIKCHIAPNRLMANPIIYERHRGDAVQKWKTGNQYAFVAQMYNDGLSINDISEVLNETRANVLSPIKAYNLFLEGKKILAKNDVSVDLASFEISNLERFSSLSEALQFLGIQFNEEDGSLIIRLPDLEFEARMLVFFNAILNSENFSREYNRRDDLKNLLEDLKKSPNINLEVGLIDPQRNSQSEQERKNLDAEKNKVTLRRKNRFKNQMLRGIIPRETNIYFGNDKLDLLFTELKSLPIDKVYSFGVILRAYLEQCLYYFIYKNNLLDELSRETANDSIKNSEAKVKKVIEYLKKDKNASKNAEDVDRCMTILRFKPSPEYSSIGLKAMLDYVLKNHLSGHVDTQIYRNLKVFIELYKDSLDLVIHNINTIVDADHNRRAWSHFEPLIKYLSENIPNE